MDGATFNAHQPVRSLGMLLAMARLVLCLAFLCGACGAQSSFTTGTRAWSDPGLGPFYHAEREAWIAPGYGPSAFYSPSIACDRYGRCWQLDPFDRFARGHRERPDGRPPGWAERLPEGAPMRDRFLRPRSDVVCDRATRICYKAGNIDKSDTENVFGDRAGDRADDLRDRYGTARLFVPERGVSCDRTGQVCLDDGDPDRSLTRRYFGRRAARALDDERRGDEDASPAKRKSKRKKN